MCFYYFAVLMYWVFHAAIEHGGSAAGATLSVILFVDGICNRDY